MGYNHIKQVNIYRFYPSQMTDAGHFSMSYFFDTIDILRQLWYNIVDRYRSFAKRIDAVLEEYISNEKQGI